MSAAVGGAQARPTATRSVQPSVFVLGTGVLSGLEGYGRTSFTGGKNIAFTAGIDVGVYSIGGRYLLGIEGRGTYPVAGGQIVEERSVLGGVRITREPGETGRLRPYLNVLFGRGQMDYQNGGYLVPGLLYSRTASNVLDGGGGVELDVTDHFSGKVDVQEQHWNTPVVSSGAVYSTQVSIGLVYRIGAGRFPR